ncbi:hypothetical protein RA210_U230048 [Rubrivivax sp. A210]|nr:hypothetical protein RA210_U230048 [Rubrivivax sp. A210]
MPLRFVNADLSSATVVYIADEQLPQGEALARYLFVLQRYRVETRTAGAVVSLPCLVWRDGDLMHNYTKKSRDQVWLQANGYKLN